MLCSALLALIPQAPVDLSLTPAEQCLAPGLSVDVDLVLSNVGGPQDVGVVEVLLNWDPAELTLDSVTPIGNWFGAGFLNDPDDINVDIADGEALYTLLGNPVTPQVVDGDFTTAVFRFTALTQGEVSLAASAGQFAQSQVLGTSPGQDITGALGGPVSVVTSSVVALEVMRLGTPPNPAALLPGVTTSPIVGQVWDPVVDHTTFLPDGELDFLALTLGPANIPFPEVGTVLCQLPVQIPLLSTVAGVPFSLPLPSNCNLLGVTVCTQAFSLNQFGDIALTNALDITFGTL